MKIIVEVSVACDSCGKVLRKVFEETPVDVCLKFSESANVLGWHVGYLTALCPECKREKKEVCINCVNYTKKVYSSPYSAPYCRKKEMYIYPHDFCPDFDNGREVT